MTVETAESCGLFEVQDASKVYPDFAAEPAIVIPYFDTAGQLVQFERGPFCRIRYLSAPKSKGFARAKAQRYSQPRGSGMRAYFPPLIDWQRLTSETGEPCIITEGEAKGIVAAAAGLPIIALGGVFNWGSGESLLPELEAIPWPKRDTYIVFDSDAALNPSILMAEARLVDELQRKRGARCFIVRLPHDGPGKTGLDDYLLVHGAQGLIALMQAAPSLGALDAKVVSLNRSCAWIEQEGMVYDLEEKQFIRKDNFISGSRFSSLEHITTGGTQRAAAPKKISVARAWLTHPHAQRYGEILFRPSEPPIVHSDNGRPALNMWGGWESEPAAADDPRVAAWLELTRYLFQNLRPEDRDLPVKLLAYKAQHPEEKIPLAFVLIGTQGCGKTLWGECVRDAFTPYGVDITPYSLAGEFQGWLEKSIFGLINEAKGEDIWKASEQLKALISDLKRPMNEKFRPVRQIRTYTLYCITSNNRAVGAYSADDRRMIVVDCPKKMTSDAGNALYTYLGRRHGQWYPQHGPRALLGYLLNLDLAGWRPPLQAPSTAEKNMAHMESLTPVQKIAEDMATADQNIVKLWLDSALAWATANETNSNHAIAAMARATADSVPRYQVRPFYTPQELALLFPDILANLQGIKFARSTPSGQISRELRDAGVPYLTNTDDPRGFKYRGTVQQFLVVAQFDEWREPMSQAEFDRVMSQCPTYAQLTGAKVRR